MNILSISVFVILFLSIFVSLDGLYVFAMLLQIVIMGLYFGLIAFLRKQTFSTKVKKLIYWGVSLTLPALVMGYICMQVLVQVDFSDFMQEAEFSLEISDIRPVDTNEYEKHFRGGSTFLLDWGMFDLSHDDYDKGLSYSLYQSSADFVAEKILNGQFVLVEYEIEEGLRWEEIYQSGDITVWEYFENSKSMDEYLIQSGKNLIHISFRNRFTEDEKEKAVKILLAEMN